MNALFYLALSCFATRTAYTMKLREKINQIIFGYDTMAGRLFDVVLFGAIIGSVITIALESVVRLQSEHGTLLRIVDWVFTIVFTIEYALRIYSAKNRRAYALSFYGIVDLCSFVPAYLSIFFAGAHFLLTIRILRLLRIFLIFKLSRYLKQSRILVTALKASIPKITVFLLAVVTLVIIVGTVMYIVEGPENGFSDIPTSIYWAIVTLTTVGYGDIIPQTALGKLISSVIMIMGYGIIAVPTGIVSVELAQAGKHDEER